MSRTNPTEVLHHRLCLCHDEKGRTPRLQSMHSSRAALQCSKIRHPGGDKPMTYDLLIRDGRIVDGSGMPAFRGDVGVKDGKIAEIGKLSGTADRIVDA